ncbi:MAG TPA: 3D domain-containing protein [Gemmatimonadaceae bacterium]|nr:3D domain-containing protein [Gemmatimonadaceae bacterium]
MKRAVALGVVAALLALRVAVPRRPGDFQPRVFAHPPVVVFSAPRLSPLLVHATRPHRPDSPARAPEGEAVPVQITAYCLRGFTRLGHEVREGIIAADPRVFPLGREVELFVGREHRGRFLVSDTGRKIKGRRIDVWMDSCRDAIRFGRRRGKALLVARADS